jgi:Zn-dependent peptidase ImmA (M78 family)
LYLNPETYEKINQCAAEFLEDFGFTDFPIDPFAIFSALSVKLIPYSDLTPEVRSLALSASGDAFHIAGSYTNLSSLVVAYNDNIEPHRIRFSLCHELGHIILEHDTEHSEWDETEADWCAGYLLAPDPVAISHKLYTPESIMKAFDVGYQCAQVVASHVSNRSKCGKSWEEYEERLISTCTVKGVVKLKLSK